jgi:hypothetical protein
METMGPIDARALAFLADLGRRLTAITGDPREHSFLLQRISMALQRFNCICFIGSFTFNVDEDTGD